MTPQLRNVLGQTYAGEEGGQSCPEWLLWDAFIPDRVSQDLPDFLLRAAAVTLGALLELCLDLVVELSNQELRHGRVMISRYQSRQTTLRTARMSPSSGRS